MAKFSYLDEMVGGNPGKACVDELASVLDKNFPKSPKPKYDKNQVALAIYALTIHEENVPRVMIWNDDSVDVVVQKLDRMLMTPTGRTENQISGIKKVINPVMNVLYKQDHTGATAQCAALGLVGRLAGKEKGTAYVDIARGFIQYQSGMFENLTEQFGKKFFSELDAKYPEFSRKLMAIRGLQSNVEILGIHPGIHNEFDRTAAENVTQMPVRRIFFNGMSDGIEEERKNLADHIRRQNNYHNKFGDGAIVLPVFIKWDVFGGLLKDNARKGVRESSMYVEIVGDGFGDTSLLMAQAAYETAKSHKTPRLVLLKTKRKAKSLKYGEQFLNTVNSKDVVAYEKPYDTVQAFDDKYLKVFTGKMPSSEMLQIWQKRRKELLAGTARK